jgi:hypothetical protein
MALVLDAGALIAIERGDPAVLDLLKSAHSDGVKVRTTSTVVSQVWRDGRRQARLSSALRGIEEVAHDRSRSRRIGELLGRAGASDVVDAGVVDIAADGDDVLTSDVDDLAELATAVGRRLTLIAI